MDIENNKLRFWLGDQVFARTSETTRWHAPVAIVVGTRLNLSCAPECSSLEIRVAWYGEILGLQTGWYPADYYTRERPEVLDPKLEAILSDTLDVLEAM